MSRTSLVNDDGSITITEADGSQVTATPDGSGLRYSFLG